MADKMNESDLSSLSETIWEITKDLFGSFNYSAFRQYVIGILFYRFLSEDLTSFVKMKIKETNTHECEFDFAAMSDSKAESIRDSILKTKGYFMLPSELFKNVRKNSANDSNLNETLVSVFNSINESASVGHIENNLNGLFDDLDFNSSKLGATVAERNKKLVILLNSIGNLPIEKFEYNSSSPFGFAFECLMDMYCANSGRPGGESYTAPDVSELLARITVCGKREVNKVYDPACGSGSLLLKFAKILGKGNVRNGFFGQEINSKTYNLCRINFFLNELNFDQYSLAHGNTLIDHKLRDKEPFEAIVSNPPYSQNWDGDSNPKLVSDERYTPAGVFAPQSMADLAFVMHSLSCLDSNGTAAIVLYPGVMYRLGPEQAIRKYLIEGNFVESVIQLPPNLFFGTTHAYCILVLKKNKTDSKILFINAIREFAGNSRINRFNQDHMEKILACYAKRESHKCFSRLVEISEIAINEYSLKICDYVESQDSIESINMSELDSELEAIAVRQSTHRAELDAILVELRGDVT